MTKIDSALGDKLSEADLIGNDGKILESKLPDTIARTSSLSAKLNKNLGTAAASQNVVTDVNGNIQTEKKVVLPSKLPNPHVLKITVGASTTSYDGSKEASVTIPNGSDYMKTKDYINDNNLAVSFLRKARFVQKGDTVPTVNPGELVWVYE